MARYAMASRVFATRVFNTWALSHQLIAYGSTRRIDIIGTSLYRVPLQGTSIERARPEATGQERVAIQGAHG